MGMRMYHPRADVSVVMCDDVSPARAGIDRVDAGGHGVRAGFPRSRGDRPDTDVRPPPHTQFPPLARG